MFGKKEKDIVFIDSTTNHAGFSLRRAKVPGGWLVGLAPDLALCFYPDPNHEWYGQSLGSSNHENRKCDFCAEIVKKEAIICKHCGRDLPAYHPKVVEPAAAIEQKKTSIEIEKAINDGNCPFCVQRTYSRYAIPGI